MIASTLLRASGRLASIAATRSTVLLKGASVRVLNGNALRQFTVAAPISAAAAAAAPARKTTRTSPAGKTTAAKKPAAKKPAAKKSAAKKQAKPKVEKAKPWEKIGEDGKPVPLPSASKPKRQSSFIFYVQSRTPDLRNDPKMLKDGTDKVDIIKMSRQMGAEWKAMSDEQKRPFHEQARRRNQEYERELEQWRESLSLEDIRRQNLYHAAMKRKGSKAVGLRINDERIPKKGNTSFFVFMHDLRERDSSIAGMRPVDAARKAGEMWKALSPAEKKPYEERSAAERERYFTEKEAYKQESQ